MLLRPDSVDRAEIVTDVAMALVLEAGLGALTLRRLGRQVGITSGGLVNIFGSRGQMLAVVATKFRDRWYGWLMRRQHLGPAGLLPTHSDDLVGVRFWLALQELSRDDTAVSFRFGRLLKDERGVVQHFVRGLLGRELDEADLDGLIALLHGLRAAVCERPTPMDLERADAALGRHLQRIGSAA